MIKPIPGSNEVAAKGGKAKPVMKREESESESESDDEVDDNEVDNDVEENDDNVSDEESSDEPVNDDNDNDNNDDQATDCMYKTNKKKPINLDAVDDADDDDAVFDDDLEVKHETIITDPKDRKTKMFLYRYEYVRALGERANMLAYGAKPMVKNVDNLTPKEIAKLELKMGVMPYIIQRKLPDGTIERFNINELKKLT